MNCPKILSFLIFIFQLLNIVKSSLVITANNNNNNGQTFILGGESIQFSFCSPLTPNYNICWNLNSTHIQIAYSLQQATPGWIGFGFSQDGTMVGSSAVVGWKSDDGTNTNINNYDLTTKPDDSSGFQTQNTLQLTQMIVDRTPNNTTLLFTRPLTVTNPVYNINPTQPINFIYASGQLPPSSNSVFGIHYDKSASNTITFASTGGNANTATSSSGSASTGKILTVDGQSYNFDQCAQYQASFEICWNLQEQSNLVQISVSASGTGWIGMAFSKSGTMSGASGMIGWASIDGSNKQVDNYELYQHGVQISGRSLQPTNTAVGYSNGRTIMIFTRPLTISSISQFNIDPTEDITIIYAKGGLPPTSTSSPNQHSQYFQGASINFSTGKSNAGDSSKNTLKNAHGALMAISWGIFLPLGILFARYFKGYGPIWFHLHRIFNTIGLLMALSGWIIGLSKLNATKAHSTIGAITMIAALFQPVNALIRPHPPAKGGKPTTLRLIWQIIHKNIGRIAFILAIVNCLIGFNLLNPPSVWLVLFNLCWASLVTYGIFLQIQLFFDDSPPFSSICPSRVQIPNNQSIQNNEMTLESYHIS